MGRREGLTTGTCAAAAAKAAALVLLGRPAPAAVEIALPDGARVSVPLVRTRRKEAAAEAAVRKDGGDDPDVTHGLEVISEVAWNPGREILLEAGEGVGTVTRPGLSVPPGEPAINPVPRLQIRAALREVTDRGLRVTISIPGGRELAGRTFNPRLGIRGGLSILGTSGRVRPFSGPALQTALACALDVAVAGGIRAPVFVPGHIGERAARRHLPLQEGQVVEVSNEWGYMLDRAAERAFSALLVLGHPGKLAKLPLEEWDTHSARSRAASPFVSALAEEVLGRNLPESPTVEGVFSSLSAKERSRLAGRLAERVRAAVEERLRRRFPAAAVLVNLSGEWLGSAGNLRPWR